MKKKINLIFLFSIMLLATNNVFAYQCSNGQEYVGCGSGANAVTGIPAFIPNLTSFAITLMRIVIPIALVITGTIELFKSIISGNPDNIPKGKKKITNKFIGALLAFFVITFTTNIVKLIAKRNERSSLASCLSCYLNNNCTDDESVCRDTNDKVIDDEDGSSGNKKSGTNGKSSSDNKTVNPVVDGAQSGMDAGIQNIQTITQSGNQTTTSTQENSSGVDCSTISNPYAKEQCEKGRRGTSTTTQSGNQATTSTQENSSSVDCSKFSNESVRHICEEAQKKNSNAVQSIPSYKGVDCSALTDSTEKLACELANNPTAQEILKNNNEIKQNAIDKLPSSLKN